MDALSFQDVVSKYLKEITSLNSYQELLTLSKEIKTKYFYTLSNYDIAKSAYLKASKASSSYLSLQKKYQEAKTALYEKEEVKTYLSLRHILEDKINADLKSIYEGVVLSE